jgi:hypothetical protein
MKKRVGRPTKPAKPGKKAALGLRVTAEIKAALDEAAHRNGRTQSQEAELRLERSFRDQQHIAHALEATYGRQLAGLLLVLARVMNDTGSLCGLVKTYTIEGATEWPSVPYAFDQVVKAVNVVLEAFRPEGDVSAPSLGAPIQLRAGSMLGAARTPDYERAARSMAELIDAGRQRAVALEAALAGADRYQASLGEGLAAGAVEALSNRDQDGMFGYWARPVRDQLGPLVKRIEHLAMREKQP